MTQEFKKGDRVKIRPNNVMYAGEEGVITKIPVSGRKVDGEGVKEDICRVKLDKNDQEYFPVRDLEKLP